MSKPIRTVLAPIVSFGRTVPAEGLGLADTSTAPTHQEARDAVDDAMSRIDFLSAIESLLAPVYAAGDGARIADAHDAALDASDEPGADLAAILDTLREAVAS